MTKAMPALALTDVYPADYYTTFFAPFMFYNTDWGEGIIVESEYKVAITEYAKANEQRIIYSNTPYRSVQFTLFSESRLEQRHLVSLSRRIGTARCLMPLYTDELTIESPVLSGESIISCLPGLSRVCVNCKIIIVNPATEEFELGTVIALSPTTITLSAGVIGSYPDGCFIIPLFLAEVSEKASLMCESPILCESKLSLDESLCEYSLDATTPMTSSIPVFEFPTDWSATVTLAGKRTIEMQGDGPTPLPMLVGTKPLRRITISLLCLSKEEAFSLINLFDSVRGSLKPFYFDLLDFPIDYSAFTANSITIEDDTGMCEFYVGDYITQIATDGTRIQRTIAGVVPVAGGFVFTMSGGPWLTDPSLVDSFVPTLLARLDKPTLKEEWQSPSIMKTKLTITEVLDNSTFPMDLSELI